MNHILLKRRQTKPYPTKETSIIPKGEKPSKRQLEHIKNMRGYVEKVTYNKLGDMIKRELYKNGTLYETYYC